MSFEKNTEKVLFSASVTFNETVILKLFRAEYYTYEKLKIIGQIVAAMLLCGISLFASGLPSAIKAALLMLGVLLFTFRDFVSQFRAEAVLQQRKNVESQVHYHFTNKCICAENQVFYKYKQLDRLVMDKTYIYLFLSPQTAIIFPRASLTPENMDAFLTFLEQKTGKNWESANINFLHMNLKDLCRMVRDQKAMRRMLQKK